MRRLRRNSIVLAAILSFCPVGIQAQKRQSPHKPQERLVYCPPMYPGFYDQVLDIVFPRDILNGILGYALVLRYEPTYELESQIVIIQRASRKGVLEYSTRR